MTDLPRDGAVRMERARADFVKGVVRKDAPGMVYYPTYRELAETYDLVEIVIARTAKQDNWVQARTEAMTSSVVVPFSAAVDANPEIVKRSEIVAKAVEELDDMVFDLAKRAIQIAQRAVEELEDEEDPLKAIRGLRSVSQTMESLHRTAKQAYDPASVRPENTVNINVSNVQASDDVVQKVAAIYARMEQEALSRGIELDNVIEGEVVEGDEDEAVEDDDE